MFYSSHENRKENKYTYSYKYQSTIFIIENYSSLPSHLRDDRRKKTRSNSPLYPPLPPPHPSSTPNPMYFKKQKRLYISASLSADHRNK